jgi:hypothetical protein
MNKKIFEDMGKYWDWFKNILYKDINIDKNISYNDLMDEIEDYLGDVNNIYLAMHFENIVNLYRVILFLGNVITDITNIKNNLYDRIIENKVLFITDNNYYEKDILNTIEKYYSNIDNMINLKKISLMGKTYKYVFENTGGNKLKVCL